MTYWQRRRERKIEEAEAAADEEFVGLVNDDEAASIYVDLSAARARMWVRQQQADYMRWFASRMA